jgi:ATP-binding cassette subfamily C protein
MIKIVYVLMGSFFILVGAVGVLLPLLPTTPFLLAAVFCLARGSKRFHLWFTGTALYRRHLESFAQSRSMTLSTKIKILGMASGMLLLAFLHTDVLMAKVALICAAAGKYYYFIFRIKTIRAQTTASVQRRLLSLVRNAGKYIVLTVLLRWVGLLCSVTAVAAMAFLLQAGLEQRLSSALLFRLLLLFSGAVALRFFCVWLSTEYSHRAAAQAKRMLRSRIYAKLLKTGLAYREKISTASMLQMSVEGVEQLQVYLGGYLPQLFYSLLAPVTLFVLLSFINIKIALILLLCVPLIPLSMMGVQKAAGRLMREYWGKYTDLGKGFLESLQGLTTLKIYDADKARHEQMNASAESFRKITMKVLRMQLSSVTVMDLIAYGGTAAGIIVSLTEVGKGSMALWSGICVILLSSEFFLPLRLLGSFFHSSMNGIAAGEKMFAFLDMEEPEEKSGKIKGFDIRLSGCGFSYGGDRDVLKNIYLDIPARSFVAIVGESGSGKSTLAGILAGVHRNYTGSARIGGKELEGISGESIMRSIVLVEHNGYIFKGTVADNLLMGCPGASAKEMMEALKKVKLHDFVMAQGGLAMKLREQGTNLSGGQRQRLALARALLHGGDIFIFDEATSNMDVESEEGVMQAIDTLTGEKTVILITHRMAVAGRAGRIFVLKNGVLTGSGTHGALYRQNAYYASLVDTQHSMENFLEVKEGALCAEAGYT